MSSDGDVANSGGIKMVVAVVRPDVLGDVKRALAEAGAPSLTVTNVSGRGSQPAKTEQWRGEEYVVDLHQKVKIECVVADIPAVRPPTRANQATGRSSSSTWRRPTRSGPASRAARPSDPDPDPNPDDGSRGSNRFVVRPNGTGRNVRDSARDRS
jgi:hypothetical protein